jgi:WD40 repeat protein
MTRWIPVCLVLWGIGIGWVNAQTPQTDLPPHAVLRLGNQGWRGSAPIVASAWSPDGKELLTIGSDHGVSLWDVRTGAEKKRLDVGGTSAGGAVPTLYLRPGISADARSVAVLGRDGVVRVWDITAGTTRFEVRASNPSQIALSRSGEHLAIFSQPAMLRIYSVTEKRLLHEFSLIEQGRPSRFAYRLDFSPDGKTLLQIGIHHAPNGVAKPAVTVWDVTTGKIQSQAEDLPDLAAVNQFYRAFPTPDHKEIVCSIGGDLVFFDIVTGKEKNRLRQVEVTSMSSWWISPSGNEVVQLIGRGDAVVVWNRREGKVLQRFGPTDSPDTRGFLSNASISPDGQWLAYGDGLTVQLIHLATGARRGGGGHRSGLLSAYFTPDGKSILTRSQENYCQWDALTGTLGPTYRIDPPHTSFLLTRDMKWMIATHPNMTLHIFDAVSKKEKHVIPLNLNTAYTYSCAPDSRTLIVLGQHVPTLQVFDLVTGEKIADLTLPNSPGLPGAVAANPLPRRITISRDSRLFAGSLDSQVIIWNLSTRRRVQQIDFPNGQMLRQMSFSPDGRLLALEFYQGDIAIWEVASGTRRLKLDSPRDGADNSVSNPAILAQNDGTRLPSALAFSPDGRLFAQATTNAVIRLYDARTGQRLGTLEGHRRAVTSLAFSPDSQRLVSACADATALVWDVKPFHDNMLKAPVAESSETFETLWTKLAGTDAAQAYTAMQALTAQPIAALKVLRSKLRPASPDDEKLLAQLVADLDAPQYATRKRAQQELERQGETAIPALQKALHEGSAEARAAARRLIETASHRPLTVEQIQQIRAVEVLERIVEAMPEAEAFLKELSRGAPSALMTQEAQRAVARIREAREGVETR